LYFSATHSLQYLYTASSGIRGLPEYISVGEVDGVVISYYDSNKRKEVARQNWMADHLNGTYWANETEVGIFHEKTFKENINILKQRFNNTGGIAVFQKMYGCRWEDETDATVSFEAFGYNGEDFMSLEVKTMSWTSTLPQAANTVYRWNHMESYMPHRKAYFQKDCFDWLKKYVRFGNNHLGRKVRSEVSLFQKRSEVVCHATGFYPDAVMITWKKDGVEMMDDVDVGETLPNEDGTFQKRAVLTISPEERKKAQYSCEVTHKSGDPIVLDHEEELNLPLIIAIQLVVVVLIAIVAVAIMMKKKKEYTVTSQEDHGSLTSKA
ncbi:class I histocompatibility antigen, F10 alpha chain-like, partial [Engraulis encrasicolus]|uniref:class I histocompatibility antigen, F10 alpha chain-like n=1 Tax=Engraulis encrasicolus TaxID=184585 RepID=UPI002FD1D898